MDNPAHYVTNIINELMRNPNAVMIGSRGLGLKHWVDTDFVVYAEEVPADVDDRFKKFEISKYFRVIPPGQHYMTKVVSRKSYEKLDLIVMNNRAAVEYVRQAMEDIMYVPRYIMEHKEERISMFELALEHAISVG